LAAAFAPAGAAAQENRSRALINACWARDELVAKPGEKAARRGMHQFDKTPPQMTLAAYAALPADTGVVRRVILKGPRKLIALTFDLCEQPGEIAGYDGAIVDYLRSQNIKATLFAGGKWLRSHEVRAQQLMADPLFEVGSHGEAHRNLRKLAGDRLVNEILGPQRSYEIVRARLAARQCAAGAPDAMSAVPARIALFRLPYGACDARALQALHDQGLTPIQWDFATGDPDRHQSARAIVQTMLRHARPGAIIVAHANGRGWHTAEALRQAVPLLRAKGYEFVTVSELLAAGQPVREQRCYDRRPGDLDRYDFLVAHRTRPSGGWTTTIHR
jgi:peptidoglycan/xylan/chitin deacetylase (PgdA/CDA1 family)